MPEHTHYDTLEVHPGATQDEIKRSYRRLAKLCHPDITKQSRDHERIAGINAAYEILSDPSQRRSYDVQMRLQRPSGAQRSRAASETASGVHSRKTSGRSVDDAIHEWIQFVYYPVTQALSHILNTLDAEVDELAGDPFDDELMDNFQLYLATCQETLSKAQTIFRSRPNPSTLAGAASNLYYCLSQVGDGLEELERFSSSYDDYYLHTGQELFRIARGLKYEVREAVRGLA